MKFSNYVLVDSAAKQKEAMMDSRILLADSYVWEYKNRKFHLISILLSNFTPYLVSKQNEKIIIEEFKSSSWKQRLVFPDCKIKALLHGLSNSHYLQLKLIAAENYDINCHECL